MIRSQGSFPEAPPFRHNRRLRVVWLHDTARRIGGCESYICNTQKHLENRGVESILMYGENGRGPLDMLPNFKQAFPIVDLAKQLAKIKPDVVYAHRIEGELTPQILSDSGIPSLRFFHDHKLFCPREHKYTVLGSRTCSRTIGANCYRCMGIVTRSSNWPGIRVRTVRRLRKQQRAHHGMTGYVVASDYMRQHLVDHGFDSKKIHCLPLYVQSPESAVSSAGRQKDQLLFVGQIVRGKGLDTLLRAMVDVAERIQLTVVGTGAQEMETQMLAKQLGLGKRVRFVGQKNRSELNQLFETATALVVPSRSPETFGQVGIEAMSHGLPAIASDVGGMREWLSPEKTGLFFDGNVSGSLATAITRLTEDSELRSRLSNQSKHDHLTRFLPVHHVDPLRRLLGRITEPEGTQLC